MWEILKDWAPIGISLVSVAIASIALYRNVRYGTVEPHWRIEVIGQGDTTTGGNFTRIRAVNIGDGEGFEVRLGALHGCKVHPKQATAFATDRVLTGEKTGSAALYRDDDDWSKVKVEVLWTRRPTHLRRVGRLTLAIAPAVEAFKSKPKLKIN